MRVADDLVANWSAEEFVDGQIYGFPFNIPKGDVYGADGASVYTVGREEVAAEHQLPQTLCFPRVGSDDDFGEVIDGFHDCASHAGCSDFTESVDSGVGLDAYEQ